MTSPVKGKEVFSCKRFSVRELENGSHLIYTFDGVGILAIDAEGRMLMTREYRPKLDRVVWRIPAGKVDAGEKFLETAHRELREESGFDAREMVLLSEYDVTSPIVVQRRAFFVARGLFESPLDTGDEVIPPEVHFLYPSEVLDLLNSGEINGEIAAVLYRYLHTNNLV